MIRAFLRPLAVMALWLAFPMVALAHDPPESGVTSLYPLSTAALVAGATAAAAAVARRALERERNLRNLEREIRDRLSPQGGSPDNDLEDLHLQQ